MTLKVVFRPEAEADLLALYRYIAKQSGARIAAGYIARIEGQCMGLATFPERGTRRDDLEPGLRILGFERRVLLALKIEENLVRIIRIFYGGRDLESAWDAD